MLWQACHCYNQSQQIKRGKSGRGDGKEGEEKSVNRREGGGVGEAGKGEEELVLQETST